MKIIKCEGFYGSYTWKETLYLDDDDDRDPVQVAFAQMRRRGLLTLPMASSGGRVVDVEYVDDEG